VSTAERVCAHPDPANVDVCVGLDGRIQSIESEFLADCGWGRGTAIGRRVGEMVVSLESPALGVALAERADSWTGLVAVVDTNAAPPRPARATLRRVDVQGYHLSFERLAQATSSETGPALSHGGSLHAQQRALLLNAMPVFCYTVDANLVFTSSEGAGLRGLQLNDGQVVGMKLTDLWGTNDPSYEPLACHLRALAGLEQCYQDVCLGRSLEYRLAPLCDARGVIAGVLGLGIDVTEREAAKEEQRKIIAQLRQAQKVEAIGQLAGGVAHDFNNLLTCIMGNLALAELRAADPAKLRRHIAEANAAADSAADLTRQLLAFGRKQVIDPRPVNVSSLIERMAGMLQRLIGERIRLSARCEPELWTVMADPGQLEQVLVNLVVNARDAIDGYGEITITTRNVVLPEVGQPLMTELEAGRYVVFSVEDTGRGMSQLVRSKLFEPFFTTKPTGDGTGLGLATVHGAIKQSGGAIAVESTLGAGSAFRIHLPAIDAEPRSEVLGNRVSGAPLRGGSETILLVEDEPLLLELADCTLQQLGYRVLACTNADAALRTFADNKDAISLLVTDVVMPRMDGRELAGRITRLKPGLQVLYSSGYGGSIIAQHGSPSGSVNFLPKPYRPAELADKVRELLDDVPQGPVAVP